MSKEMDELRRWLEETHLKGAMDNIVPASNENVHDHMHAGSAAEIVVVWVRNAIAANLNAMFEEFDMIAKRSHFTQDQLLSAIRHYGGDKLAQTYIHWKGL